jgi:hypothetical protein
VCVTKACVANVCVTSLAKAKVFKVLMMPLAKGIS